MSDDLVGGLYFKKPNEKAPDFVVGKLSINKEQFTEWYREQVKDKSKEWINLDIKISKAGKPYISVDTWEPDADYAGSNNSGFEPKGDFEDDIPF